MTTEQRVQIADNYHSEGYNCAQAVAASFKDIVGLDEKTLLNISSSFGGGMGKLREVCGAFSGMAMIAGLLYGGYGSSDEGKQAHYALIRELAERFRQRHDTIICRDLLAAGDAAGINPCPDLIRDAVRVMSEFIEEKKNEK